MFYPKLVFPTKKNRPFFYTNFVQTVDGKTQVKKPGYFPIGSKLDYSVLTELRAYADCLIHGGNLGREYGLVTSNSLNKPQFKALRERLGKSSTLPYYLITNHPKSLPLDLLERENINVYQGSLRTLAKELKKKGFKHVLVEGGPTLLASFLKENLIDEVFLTIAPKIYGTEEGQSLTLVEGYLFPKNSIKKLKLLTVKPSGDELFLRYKVTEN